uniref:Uncharacterized protein n=1 Tax=Onchocerca volvulus TaxID=6282 RepID=A0A8R1TNT8_ONCVO
MSCIRDCESHPIKQYRRALSVHADCFCIPCLHYINVAHCTASASILLIVTSHQAIHSHPSPLPTSCLAYHLYSYWSLPTHNPFDSRLEELLINLQARNDTQSQPHSYRIFCAQFIHTRIYHSYNQLPLLSVLIFISLLCDSRAYFNYFLTSFSLRNG